MQLQQQQQQQLLLPIVDVAFFSLKLTEFCVGLSLKDEIVDVQNSIAAAGLAAAFLSVFCNVIFFNILGN
jgi:hypothetical protein